MNATEKASLVPALVNVVRVPCIADPITGFPNHFPPFPSLGHLRPSYQEMDVEKSGSPVSPHGSQVSHPFLPFPPPRPPQATIKGKLVSEEVRVPVSRVWLTGSQFFPHCFQTRGRLRP